MFEFIVTGIIFTALMIFLSIKLTEKNEVIRDMNAQLQDFNAEVKYLERKLKTRCTDCHEFRGYLAFMSLSSDFSEWRLQNGNPDVYGVEDAMAPVDVRQLSIDVAASTKRVYAHFKAKRVAKELAKRERRAGLTATDALTTGETLAESSNVRVKAIGPEGATLSTEHLNDAIHKELTTGEVLARTAGEHTLKELSEQHHEN